MEYKYIKDINGKDIKISRIILGGSSKQMIEGTYPDSFFDTMLSLGVNTIDLARLYGNGKCEEFFGTYLSRRNRDDFVVISKCCHPKLGIFKRVNRKAALSDIEKTLEALKTDHVDILLLHRDDPKKKVSEIISFMNEILSKGYTRAIGVSNWSLERVEEANKYAEEHNLIPFMVIENQFSLVKREKDSWHNGAKAFIESDFQHMNSNGIIPLCYSSLAEGYLSGKIESSNSLFVKSLSNFTRVAYHYENNFQRLQRLEKLAKERGYNVSELALAYVLNYDPSLSAIVSMSSLNRLNSNLKALEIKLSPGEMAYLRGDMKK